MSTGCFFLRHPLTIQSDIRPDTGYPAIHNGRISGQFSIRCNPIDLLICLPNLHAFMFLTVTFWL